MLTHKENRLRTYLKILLGIFFIALVFCLVNLFKPSESFTSLRAPLLIIFTALTFLNMLICWYAIADLRRFTLLVKLLIWESIITVLGAAIILIWKDIESVIVLWNSSFPVKSIVIVLIVFHLLNAILAFIFLSSAERARYGLKYFSPLQFKTLEALAEVVIYGDDEIITGEDVARNVDTYFKTFQAKSKWTMALVITCLYFYPLLSLLPPLPYIDAERRLQFLKKRFLPIWFLGALQPEMAEKEGIPCFTTKGRPALFPSFRVAYFHFLSIMDQGPVRIGPRSHFPPA